ncbi:hypothetical protein SAMN05192529_102164 [Arachidicoccus rhizosphaerae]|uniref:Uncharacterized protein n=1 Tax=Arachidicoccus rhizosphaerae TaxID=551991 RepID=A0A1H3W8B9_9BACT|nr:hypothetical protein [Arachidicoccus rhizosphaerae]SDZ82528.1 hypothetical protein SAMN05192529_102164 [Arachidicoccus rhizosphaerae]
MDIILAELRNEVEVSIQKTTKHAGLNPTEAERLKGGKTTNVLLYDILRQQLKEINSILSALPKPAFSQPKISSAAFWY